MKIKLKKNQIRDGKEIYYVEPKNIKQIIDEDAPNAMVLKSWCDSFLRIRDETIR